MSNPVTNEELTNRYNELNEQYNNLLDKNQNDLIKIRQKEKTFNETIQTLKEERQEMEKKLKSDIDVLMLQMEKMKNGVKTEVKNETKNEEKMETKQTSAKELENKENEEMILLLKKDNESLKIESKTLKEIIDNKSERIEHLEENARKLIDENIILTEENTSFKSKLKELQEKIKTDAIENQKLADKIMEMNEANMKQPEKKEIINLSVFIQTDGDFTVSLKEHNALISQFNDQIKELRKEIETKDQHNEQIRQRLKETNDELKRFMERDKKSVIILKKKGEELETVQVELENIKKNQKTDRKKVIMEEICTKCKEWEQENKLLKEMVKSMQTMVRVRELEAERYKNREMASNSKVYEKIENGESSHKRVSKGELPPLNKRN